MDKIVIGREAYDKIMYYVHKAKFEVSGFGNVELINGVPTVTDIFLLKQDNSPTETDIEADAITKALYDHHILETKGEMKFWWHSHVNMPVYWSGQDKKTIEELGENGWFIHGVFNKKNEYRLAYSNSVPFKEFKDNITMEIDENLINNPKLLGFAIEMDILQEQIDKEIANQCEPSFDELVTDKPYVPTYSGYKDYKNYNTFDKDDVVGKQIASSTKQTMANTQNITEIPFTGKMTTTLSDEIYGNKDIHEPDDAIELFIEGFTIEEIIILQDQFHIYDLIDLDWYNEHWGDLPNLNAYKLEVI